MTPRERLIRVLTECPEIAEQLMQLLLQQQSSPEPPDPSCQKL